MSALPLPIEIEGIKQILPHRDSFLFVDRIVALEPDKRIVGISDERNFSWWPSVAGGEGSARRAWDGG